MLTKESADDQVKGMNDAQIDHLVDQQFAADPDQRLFAVRAVLERARRAQQAETAARVAAPAIAAEASARTAYDAAGLPPAGFAAWYAERLGRETGATLDNQRAAARYIAQRSF
jgi:hypothetical protein